MTTRQKYERHLFCTRDWLLRSIRPQGGSAAYYMPVFGWSRAYPETTGYIIPTLIDLSKRFDSDRERGAAIELGRWLLSIQLPNGSWPAGLYPPRGRPEPSVFNTGQILLGLVALFRETGDDAWLGPASRAAGWLADGVDDAGRWSTGHYQSGFQPSYYTCVAWPMLEVWALTGDGNVFGAAGRVLDAILEKRRPDGGFADWGFKPASPASTHTIGYTLRGFLECARLLDDWDRYGTPCEQALETLLQRSERAGGRLAGAFRDGWRSDGRFVCLTGCVQIASCLLILERRQPDLRIVSGAARLVDTVCRSQFLRGPGGVAGAVPGSDPLWGPYMRFRHPNWAAKFFVDALLELEERLDLEDATCRSV